MDNNIINDILITLGLDGLPPEEGAELIERIGNLTTEAVLERATEALPEDKQDEYLALLDTNPTPDDLFAFFDAHIKNFSDIVQAALQEIAESFK